MAKVGTIGHIDHGKTALTAALAQLLAYKPSEPLPTVATQQTVANDTARDAFMNALRILHSMEPVWLPVKFTRDPANYLLRADDATVDRIWAAIQERQPARYRA